MCVWHLAELLEMPSKTCSPLPAPGEWDGGARASTPTAPPAKAELWWCPRRGWTDGSTGHVPTAVPIAFPKAAGEVVVYGQARARASLFF